MFLYTGRTIMVVSEECGPRPPPYSSLVLGNADVSPTVILLQKIGKFSLAKSAGSKAGITRF